MALLVLCSTGCRGPAAGKVAGEVVEKAIPAAERGAEEIGQSLRGIGREAAPDLKPGLPGTHTRIGRQPLGGVRAR
jgi:hypothetical protein